MYFTSCSMDPKVCPQSKGVPEFIATHKYNGVLQLNTIMIIMLPAVSI